MVGCAGDAPTSSNPVVDAGDVDAPPEIGFRLSGKVMDYFVPTTAHPDATVATNGIAPEKMAVSAADGAYEFPIIAPNSKMFLVVTRPDYRPTRNLATEMKEADVVQDVYVMSVADVRRQFTTAGAAPTAGKAFLTSELRDAANLPLVGAALADVVLTDMADQPVPGVLGPFFYGALGDIDPALLVSEANGGRSRVAFLDVPPGAYKLNVTYPDGLGGTTISTVQVGVDADGASIALAGGPIPNAAALDPKFSTEIYPRLQRAADGGVGCANCHTAGGAGAVLILDGGATQALANITAGLGVLDLVAPASSLLLTKPLYELPPTLQNHPNATFLDANDPDYKQILLWITNGAKP